MQMRFYNDLRKAAMRFLFQNELIETKRYDFITGFTIQPIRRELKDKTYDGRHSTLGKATLEYLAAATKFCEIQKKQVFLVREYVCWPTPTRSLYTRAFSVPNCLALSFPR